jgi:periplasmic protein TonB
VSISSSARLELYAYFNPEEFARLKKLEEKWVKYFWLFLLIALCLHSLFFFGGIIQKLNLIPRTPPPLTIEIVTPKSATAESETKKVPQPEIKKQTEEQKKPAELKKPAEVSDQVKTPPKVEEVKPVPQDLPPPSTGEKSVPTVDEDKLVDYAKNPKPHYPMGPYRERIQGTVWLRVQVMPDGSVGSVEIDKTSGNEELDESALSTVKKWRFNPAVKGGNAVAQYVKIPITFKLR